jgi:hypothetical protein
VVERMEHFGIEGRLEHGTWVAARPAAASGLSR